MSLDSITHLIGSQLICQTDSTLYFCALHSLPSPLKWPVAKTSFVHRKSPISLTSMTNYILRVSTVFSEKKKLINNESERECIFCVGPLNVWVPESWEQSKHSRQYCIIWSVVILYPSSHVGAVSSNNLLSTLCRDDAVSF